MKIVKLYIGVASLLWTATFLLSCTNDDITDDNPNIASANGDIVFSFGFAPQTRVSTDAEFKSTWEDGDQIGLYAVAHDGTDGTLATSNNYIHNVALTYNDAIDSWIPSEPLWWPNDGKMLSFYAYHPYLAISTLNPTTISFGVLTDQNDTANGKSYYNLCDLMTAKSDDSGAGWNKGSTVSLTFNHALAMVQVSIPSGDKGFGPSENLNVTLRGVKRGGVLNLANISATAGSEITLATVDNNPTNITMHRVEQPIDADYETTYTYRALVPTQTVAAGSSLFWFEHEGRQLLMDGALAQTLQMKAGQAETFTRTLPASVVHTVPVPAGTFLMGSSDGSNYPTYTVGDAGLNTTAAEPNRNNTNETQHRVTLTKDFRMSKYQVTNAQYAAFLNAKGIDNNGQGSVTYYKADFITPVTEDQKFVMTNIWGVKWDTDKWVFEPGFENHPVIFVSWYGAKAYTDWVGGSLPTEAQWEYACRGGTTTAFHFGDDNSAMGDYGWSAEISNHSTQAVGRKMPNAYGLYDMHGNVWEWCGDWYKDYDSNSVIDPVGPPTGSTRIVRGSGWGTYSHHSRSAYRYFIEPDKFATHTGFRVAFKEY